MKNHDVTFMVNDLLEPVINQLNIENKHIFGLFTNLNTKLINYQSCVSELGNDGKCKTELVDALKLIEETKNFFNNTEEELYNCINKAYKQDTHLKPDFTKQIKQCTTDYKKKMLDKLKSFN